MKNWCAAFRDLKDEHGWKACRIEGVVPPELEGTLWSNGPSTFSDVAPSERMWLDGDGAVSAVRIRAGQVDLAVRRVDTLARRIERAAGRRVFGRYHVRAPLAQHLGELVGKRPRRNPSNTSVWCHRGKVFALCPAGGPTEIDPETLATRGEVTLDGLIDGGFSAHASYSAPRRTFYNFSLRFGRRCALDLYAFPDEGKNARVASVPLAGPLFNHDFMLTERWAIFLLAPAQIDPLGILLGRPLGDCLHWKPEAGTEVVLIELDSPHSVVRFTVDPISVLHFANAWDEGNGDIVLHAPLGRDFPRMWHWLESVAKGIAVPAPTPMLHEVRINAARRSLEIHPLTDVVSEGPRISPRYEMRPSRFVYGTGFSTPVCGLTDRIMKVDVERGAARAISAGPATFVCEPLFIPRGAAEDDGWLIAHVFDARAEETCLAIFDGDEVVARAWFGQSIPPVFHGTWRGKGDQVGASPSSSAP